MQEKNGYGQSGRSRYSQHPLSRGSSISGYGDDPRPLALLREYADRYPGAWKTAARMRVDQGKNLPHWPDWCFLPISGAYAIVSHGRGLVEESGEVDLKRLGDVGPVAALAAWRMTKGIYRFDETVFRTIWETPVSGELPTAVLYRLPEWCCYIEAPRDPQEETGEELLGFFVHLEHDIRTGRPELRLLADFGADRLTSLIVHLDRKTLPQCIEAAIEEGRRQARSVGAASLEATDETAAYIRATVEPMVSVTLYLCSQAAEIRPADGDPQARPGNPASKKTRKGERTFAADAPTQWAVAWRLGAALRSAMSGEGGDAGSVSGDRARPRAHIRRAHWKTYWTGPQDGARTPILKWLPPTPVNVTAEDDISATIRPVD